MLPKFQQALSKVKKDKGYQVILKREAALWLDEQYDITEQVVAEMDKIQ